MRPMQHVGETLHAFLEASGLGRALTRWRAVTEWARIVGPEVAAEAAAFRFERGTLWVSVSTSSWIQHIGYLKPQILAAFRRELPGVTVKNIRCVIRRRPEEEPDRREGGSARREQQG